MIETTNKYLALSFFLAMALSALVLATLLARPAFAAGITANTIADENNADGDCSLREAILAANTDAAVDACPAGSGADTITVPAGTYTLTRPEVGPFDATVGDLDITGPTTITGAGARETIVKGNAEFNDRIFENTGTTTISGLTITGGSASSSGGVANFDNALTLDGVAVTNNRAAIFGGGISGVDGTLTVTNSTVSGNSVSGDYGGIVQFGGTANITNSTVSGNQAGDSGGGVAAESDSTINIRSSTIASNVSLDPGGGILTTFSGTAAVKNSIVSDNTTSNCAAVRDGGPITSQGSNLEFPGTSCGFTASGDIQDQAPLLGSLADNGGQTDTHALQTGSPAIDSGDSDQTTDQRSATRPRDGDGDTTVTDDIGAFELEATSPPPSNTAPVISADIPAKTKDKTPTLLASVTDNESDLSSSSQIFVFMDNGAVADFDYDPASGDLSFTSEKLKKGDHTLEIEATDGQLSSSESFTFKVKKK